ncbi:MULTISPECIES: hypothetical protein [Methylomonas]|uniref:Uncharacterized protein n=1 Tax=Methylomonas methanica TaxID=421 RepID=A0ABY2CKZ3_METMH|nr:MULTISPECIES: hypothetical protein [Methylomonas]TCV78127.1 hypothetical protein EDE11_12646 [Methylomonas methanica]
MDIACYRGMPKFVGAFIEALYQNPTQLFVAMAGIAVVVGLWWYKVNNKAE